METRLKEMAVGGGSIREGSPLALASGPILVDPSSDDGDNRVALCRARVLGGGVALRTRPMGLVLKPDDRNVMVSSQVGTAVNRRFHSFEAGVQQGVARPKDNEFIELSVHPRYKDNVDRYIQVVRAIALRESAAQQAARLTLLERQLLDPITSTSAALRLEAIGRDGIPALKKGIAHDDPEVRFYSAEALAYLDQAEAAGPLAAAVRDEPAFRAYALAALDRHGRLRRLRSPARAARFAQRRNSLRRFPLAVGHELPGRRGARREPGRTIQLPRAGHRRIADDPRHAQLSARDCVVRTRTTTLDARRPGSRQAHYCQCARRRARHGQPLRAQRTGPETGRDREHRRVHPCDRRSRRHLPGRRTGVATGPAPSTPCRADWRSMRCRPEDAAMSAPRRRTAPRRESRTMPARPATPAWWSRTRCPGFSPRDGRARRPATWWPLPATWPNVSPRDKKAPASPMSFFGKMKKSNQQ